MRFGGLTAIDALSFEAEQGKITSLIGPNGAGKTTVFNCLTGFYRPGGGSISLSDDTGTLELTRMTGHRINARGRVARTFQNIRLFARMTVLENLLVAQHVSLHRSWFPAVGGLWNSAAYRQEQEKAIDVAASWIERLDLEDWADQEAGSLPYGHQRRLEIARAMCTGPRLLCLDEPAAGLNGAESVQLAKLLEEMRTEVGVGILLIEHDMKMVMDISHHVIVLDYGRKIAQGSPQEVRNDPAVIRAYLGAEQDDDLEDLIGDDTTGREIEA
ncbi:ATP-binding cassette domain-containing protein [Aquamicrobium sp. NLF2-7]|uniref:ABC transporter ATP-binding protein n=1 Tax=Aquamicrobium sp. NLF2-7 TaxID=2918753 RepID=UPI001EFB2DA4|nr:ATP-binding cassette domain-containing protein [Aquamicrobium sp. NLF2-7]MCG8272767.1 ATP-binding cassette domain-containing protein [Aquamicrobium sp. NLF2-7]